MKFNIIDQEKLRLSFSEDQIGRHISTDMVLISRTSSVPEAMTSLIEQAADNDNLNTIYVCEEDYTYYGAIPLKELISARKDTSMEQIIHKDYPFVYASEDIDACLEEIKNYSEDSIPALDEKKRILGIITSQDLVDVVDDELGEDYAKLGGLLDEEDLHEPILTSLSKRLPWLIVLLFLGMLVSSVVGVFEKIVSEITVLMLFQSLILDMAGNVGTQSLAVTIRVLMDDNLNAKKKGKLVWKEGRVALMNGCILGFAAFIFAGLYLHVMKHEAWAYSYQISLCIGVALMIAMLVSGVLGTIIPMFFKQIHVDPAVASGPLITTVNDMVAVVTYYSLAWLLLIHGIGL